MENENVENNTIEYTATNTVVDTNVIENITQVHNDLGVVISFLVFFTLVIILRYTYKFFNMFFVM